MTDRRESDAAGAQDQAARIFTWAVWGWMCWYLFRYIRAFAVDAPYYDEWEMIPALAGRQRITFEWLWSQHNEHRIVLPRLIYLALARLTHADFRAGMYFSGVVLAACSAALIAVARRRRGYAEFTDALFAVLLLNLGQAQTLANGFQVAFSAMTAITVPILIAYTRPGPLGFRPAAVAAGCTVLLPLLGGTGIALVPALLLCAGASAWSLARGGARRQAAAVAALSMAALILLLYYFVDYHRPPQHPTSRDLWSTADGAAQFLSVGFGSAARLNWPGSRWWILAASLATLLLVGWAMVARPAERGRGGRILLFAGALLCLTVGTSWARVALGPGAMFASRYVLLAAPYWCAIYFAWELSPWPSARRFVQAGLFLCAASLIVANNADGNREAAYFRDVRAGLYRDIHDGVPLADVVARHHEPSYGLGPERFTQRLLTLKRAGIGVFKELNLGWDTPPP